ncbi:MAG: hypothetical protein KGI52_07060, partial [Burkholderiales bacterium]|nr:hypothetical protein [Burkholderiales bacterium]
RTAQVIVDAPARDFISGQVISTETTLTYATADLPALPSGAQLTLGGVLYQVREVHALDDGLISHATLAKV